MHDAALQLNDRDEEIIFTDKPRLSTVSERAEQNKY